MKRLSTLRTLFVCLAVSLSAPAAGHAEAPIGLSADQVACNAEQLGRLLQRMEPLEEGAGEVAAGAGSLQPLSGGWTLFATYADPFGAYEGLLVGMQRMGTEGEVLPERHLAFGLQPSVRELLLNPQRQPLPQVTLAREESATTLSDPGSQGRLLLSLDPSLGAGTGARLLIDDSGRDAAERAGAPARTAATGPGRGLSVDGLTDPCHYGLTEDDVRLLALVQRVFRVDLHGPDGGSLGAAIGLYRAEEPGHVRADIYPRPAAEGASSCRLSVDLGFDRTPRRTLRQATLTRVEPVGEGLPSCEPGQVGGEAFVIPANFPAGEAWSRGDASEGLDLGAPAGQGSASADLGRLLDGSRWNRPGAARSPGCPRPSEAQLAVSPRRDVNVENMAATLGGGFLADQRLYDRMRADQRALITMGGIPRKGLPLLEPRVSFGSLRVGVGYWYVVPSLVSNPLFQCLVEEFDMVWVESESFTGVWMAPFAVMNLDRVVRWLSRIPEVDWIRSGGVTYIDPPHAIKRTCIRWGDEPNSIEYWVSKYGSDYPRWFESSGPGQVRLVQAPADLPDPRSWICRPFSSYGTLPRSEVVGPGHARPPESSVEGPGPRSWSRGSHEPYRAAVRNRSAEPGGLDDLPSSQPTEAQLACSRDQLGALLARTRVVGREGTVHRSPLSLLVSQADPAGSFDGLLVGLGLPRRAGDREPEPTPEHHLGFHLDSAVRDLLLNPERLPLDQVLLARETSTSVLVNPGDPSEMTLAIDPGLRPTATAGAPGEGELVIDNLASPPAGGPGGRSSDTKPGRGLAEDGLTDICHARVDDFDRRVLSILQRTLRVDLRDPVTGRRYDTRIALYPRRARPDDSYFLDAWGFASRALSDSYGADVYLVDPDLDGLLEGRVVVRVELTSNYLEGFDTFPVTVTLELVGTEGDLPPVSGTIGLHSPSFPGVTVPGPPLATVSVDRAEDRADVAWDELIAERAWGW